MTVTKIIKTIDEMLNMGIFAQAGDEQNYNFDDARVARLLECCNAVLERLYGQYTLDYAHTVVDVVDGIAPLNSQVYRVLKLTNSTGEDVKFEFTLQGIAVDKDGRYNMTYARLPQKLTMEDNVVLPDPRFTHRLFIYGVIAEYFRRIGDYTVSESWQQKFENALTVTIELRKTARIRPRRWL